VRVITSLYEGGQWRSKKEVVVEDVLSLTMAVSSTIPSRLGGFDGLFQAALMIISAAGFGRQKSWEGGGAPPGHRLK